MHNRIVLLLKGLDLMRLTKMPLSFFCNTVKDLTEILDILYKTLSIQFPKKNVFKETNKNFK